MGPETVSDRPMGLKMPDLIRSVILLQYQYLTVADNNVPFNREKQKALQGEKDLKMMECKLLESCQPDFIFIQVGT